MSRIRPLVACFGAGAGVFALAALLAAAPAAGAANGAPPATNAAAVAKAVSWLRTQQQADGGFEVAGFAGFETPDATLAIAEAAQTGSTWSTAQALAAVQAVVKNGKTPLDALDAFADSGIDAGQAAKLIVLDAGALGLDPAHFDPAGNGGSGTDLVARLGSPAADGSFGTFNATLYAALAEKIVTGSVPTTTRDFIVAAQQANGGWNFDGDEAKSEVDVDTTAVAVEALVAAGVPVADPALQHALTFLATNLNADGSWSAFGAHDPDSTALGAIAVATLGYDPTSTCWRDNFARAKAGTTYVSPDAYLRSQQGADGRVKSPNDAFPPINTLATSQSVEGLSRSWLPTVQIATQHCVEPASAPVTTTTTTGVAAATAGDDALAADTADSGSTAVGDLPNTGSPSSVPLTIAGFACVVCGLTTIAAGRHPRARGLAARR
jgi:hypothetical protein